MKKITYLWSLLVVILFSCNERVADLPEEDYHALFPNKGKIDKPNIDYTNMTPTVCEPTENELNFVYPGVDMDQDLRDYTVTLKFKYTEQQTFPLGQKMSQFDLKYVGADKKLVVLRSYKDDKGNPPTIEEGKDYEIKFKVKSGYPLYLSVHGGGYDLFSLNASIQAKSDDGIVVSPVIKYETSVYSDGFTELTPYCEKIILP
ncbi:hypothetical protein OKE60_08120 [Riemerella anatipestifer]|uniref:hypothetical protein n=1 Tax=Riemerella anatipestifer TaxID=34085 RepID=UPI0021F84203|nr:hypothetical protein [Riemerella anatipestifer]MCW0480769.1 hypothetical protein [Riemerella anatipestifer]